MSRSIENLYGDLWDRREETSFPPDWGLAGDHSLTGVVAIPPIQLEGVKARYMKFKRKTAAGPDGVCKGDISEQALTILTMIFNCCSATGLHPASSKINRTTSIPKSGKDPEQVANWRPITISSVISRLYFGIIDQSLRQNVKFCYRQKGFTSEADTAMNVAILAQVLSNMKGQGGGVCSILDVSKAFDTVLHGALNPAPSDGKVAIELLRGVKQGDPLSPFLFNAIVDPLLAHFDNREKGITVGGQKVSVLAFADDLTVVSESVENAAEDILKTVEYFKSLGGSSLRDFVNCCKRVQGVGALKPQQKLKLIENYTFPKYRYRLALDPPTKTALKEADNEVRQILSGIFHLPESTSNYLFYTRPRDNGLGVPRLEQDIQFSVLKTRASMAESQDLVVRELAESSNFAELARKSDKSLRIQMPNSRKECDLAKQQAKNRELTAWANQTSQGQGASYNRRNELSNMWLMRDGIQQPNRMTDALRFRTNTFGNRTSLKRARIRLSLRV
ncbi:hypothetical protein JTB14_038098 [Gonioctena quinquepunctata]|nr:hypothetical protein JTB14_038098 [Gonioctena quinquepunctata]